ncbi:uncharacterized protein C9orf50 homolog isoform X2 [Trichosurus vulpecula]|uniref:uncharacterized protein C9orf50 homolog isoform X2 n=1 Tax=Trichosurus vulpecula TaxID=9337 RepID=UPI00186B221F|nr:uncharacterized protein C9orf50 homolog isoform X2 [Trichosurus vulpecula]
MPWGHINLRVQGSEPEGFSYDHHQKLPAVQVTNHGKRRQLGIPRLPPIFPPQPDPRKSSYFPRRQEQKIPQGQRSLSPEEDVRFSWEFRPGLLTSARQGYKRNPEAHYLPTFAQQVQQKQEKLKSKALSFQGQVSSVQGGKTGHAFPRTDTWATSEREGPQWSVGWGAKDFPSPVLGELLPNRPKVSREPTEKPCRKRLQHSTSFPSKQDNSSGCSCDSPGCSFCSDPPDLWSKNRQTVKLKPALITSCSDDASGPQKRFHPFRVRFADESPKDMALRYWERNYEVQRSLLKSPTSCKYPEQVSGKLGIWMEKVPRSGSQQTNVWRDDFLRAGRLDTMPMSFQELPADNLKKNSTYNSLHTSPLASLDFSGTRPYQDQATDPPKKSSIYNSLHTNTSSGIDFSGTRPFQDLPADSPKKSSTFSNLYSSTLANIDFSSPRSFQDLSIDPAKHTSIFTSPAVNTDRPRNRTFSTGASPVNENSPSLWAPRMDTFVPPLMLSTTRKGGQTGAYQFFPPLTPLRAQR